MWAFIDRSQYLSEISISQILLKNLELIYPDLSRKGNESYIYAIKVICINYDIYGIIWYR